LVIPDAASVALKITVYEVPGWIAGPPVGGAVKARVGAAASGVNVTTTGLESTLFALREVMLVEVDAADAVRV